MAFLVIYGVTPLDVTNDNWIMAGYDESDIVQHYSGWLAFRNSEWAFPMGMAHDMAVGTGTYISYTDSIPWVSILFKIFRGLLPGTFQFFGLYAISCYILQSVAAVNIIYEKSRNVFFSMCGMLLFSFAPIMMERSLRHTALGSQWLILFAILIFIYHRKKQKKIHYLWYLLLMVLSIGIHPYFLPAIAVFMLISLIDDLRQHNWITAMVFIVNLIVTYTAGCIIGVLGTGIKASRRGYGYFSMNLNALLNPTSCGKYEWSVFTKIHSQILGNYDGFNYLGFGILMALFLLLCLCIIYGKWEEVNKWIKRNWYTILILFICAIFAISNVVTFNDKIIAKIPLPTTLAEVCGIFRASSRIFYPVYYCIFIGVVIGLWRFRDKISIPKMKILIAIIVGLQLLDLSKVIVQKHAMMKMNASYDSLLTDISANRIFDGKTALLIDSSKSDTRKSAVVALKHGLKLYYSVANSGSYKDSYAEATRITDYIKKSGDIGNFVVMTDNLDIARAYLIYDNINCYERDGIYYLSETNVSDVRNVIQDAEDKRIFHYKGKNK